MVKKKDLQRLQVAGSERVSRGKRRRKRVEKSSGKGECNAQAHRRFVCTRARGESRRRGVAVGRWMVGGAFEKAAESRGGEISEEADGENWKPRPDEKPFFIFREQRSRNESKKPGSAVFPPLSSKIDSFLKKRKKRFANSSSLSIENDRSI